MVFAFRSLSAGSRGANIVWCTSTLYCSYDDLRVIPDCKSQVVELNRAPEQRVEQYSDGFNDCELNEEPL